MKCPFCEYQISKPNIFKRHIIFHHNNNYSEIQIQKFFIKSFYNIDEHDLDNIVIDYETGYSILDLTKKYSPITSTAILNYFELIGIKKRNAKESKHTNNYIEKYKNSIITKYGVDNISKSKLIKEKKVETMLKNYNRINNFSCPIIKKKAFNNVDFVKLNNKLKDKLLNEYGVDNISKIPKVKEKISNTKKIKYSKYSNDEKRKMTENARKNIKPKSKLEIKIQDILNKLKIEYTVNKFLFGYNWDLVFKNKKILEIQGDYWHANPNKYIESDIVFGKKVKDVWAKDERKRKEAEKNKYRVYYLWESEINKMNLQDLENILIKIIYENTNI